MWVVGNGLDFMGVQASSGVALIRCEGTVDGRWSDVPTLVLVVSVVL